MTSPRFSFLSSSLPPSLPPSLPRPPSGRPTPARDCLPRLRSPRHPGPLPPGIFLLSSSLSLLSFLIFKGLSRSAFLVYSRVASSPSSASCSLPILSHVTLFSSPLSFPPLLIPQIQELKPGFCSVVDNIQHDYIDSLSQPQHLKEGGVRPFHPVLETRFVVEGQDKPWADEEEEVEGGEKKVEGEGGKGGKRSRV